MPQSGNSSILGGARNFLRWISCMWQRIHVIQVVICVRVYFDWSRVGRGGRVNKVSTYCAGGLPVDSWHPTSATCREHDRLPWSWTRGMQVWHQGESEASVVHRWGRTHVRDPPWFWNPGHTRSPKQRYQWPHKKDSCPLKIYKKNVSTEVCLTNRQKGKEQFFCCCKFLLFSASCECKTFSSNLFSYTISASERFFFKELNVTH